MTDQQIDITGLSKAEVLAALFNASAPAGMGFLQAGFGPSEMSVEDAKQYVTLGTSPDPGSFSRRDLYFDYVLGRPLKLDLSDDSSFNPWGFDRDNGGPGSAQKVIDRLRATKDVNPEESQEEHITRTHLNAHEAMAMANTVTTIDGDVFNLGGNELGEPLQKAVDAKLTQLQS